MERMTTAPRILAALLLGAAALTLTGCQSGPGFDRTVNLTTLTDPEFAPEPEKSLGLDLHFGGNTLGFTCATDSAGDSTRGTAALICSWNTVPR